MSKAKAKVIDYDGYDYADDFWGNGKREYEDQADRLAIQRLLPKKAANFIDVAGGYGRLADEYLNRGYGKVTLFDYSKDLLNQAKKHYGAKLHTQQGDAYQMPFQDASCDALMMVRATHHFSDFDQVVSEISRILKPGGIAVIELANKRTLPRVFRYWFGRSKVNPFSHDSIDITGKGFYNYHPKYAEALFAAHGLKVQKILSVSNLRSNRLKRTFSTKFLMSIEKFSQRALAPFRFGPSVYYQLKKVK
ncbi:class I SAM-dependent methyltransferase [Candidatus Saccharibacteria bacterium]|nr:class I SAM-dependent methyltransferase [Candidatus Saccharibacteria bacterium]